MFEGHGSRACATAQSRKVGALQSSAAQQCGEKARRGACGSRCFEGLLRPVGPCGLKL